MSLVAIVCAALAGMVFVGRSGTLERRLGAQVAGQPKPTSAHRPHVRLTTSAARWGVTHFQSRRAVQQRESDVTDACLALTAHLRSGMSINQALIVVSEDWPDLLGTAAGQAAIGGDVAAALREAAAVPGAEPLHAIAASCDVTDRTGAPLSAVLMAVADSLRMAAAVRREAESQLATARTTARLLAVLPFGTLLLLSGGDRAAIGFLFTTPVGLGCLAAAATFVGAGMWWVRRVARSAQVAAWGS